MANDCLILSFFEVQMTLVNKVFWAAKIFCKILSGWIMKISLKIVACEKGLIMWIFIYYTFNCIQSSVYLLVIDKLAFLYRFLGLFILMIFGRWLWQRKSYSFFHCFSYWFLFTVIHQGRYEKKITIMKTFFYIFLSLYVCMYQENGYIYSQIDIFFKTDENFFMVIFIFFHNGPGW